MLKKCFVLLTMCMILFSIGTSHAQTMPPPIDPEPNLIGNIQADVGQSILWFGEDRIRAYGYCPDTTGCNVEIKWIGTYVNGSQTEYRSQVIFSRTNSRYIEEWDLSFPGLNTLIARDPFNVGTIRAPFAVYEYRLTLTKGTSTKIYYSFGTGWSSIGLPPPFFF